MTILILGGADDDHASYMLAHLRAKGEDVHLIDGRTFPASLRIAQDPVAGRWTLTLPGGRKVPHGSVKSIYWRCYDAVSPPHMDDAEQAYIASNDARSLFESFLQTYPTRWVNGWDGYLAHQTKPAALAKVSSLGIDVPRTLSSNDPDEVVAFVKAVGRAIFKPVQGGAHAAIVTEKHLTSDNLRSLQFAPVTLQEEVVGTNIRAFVAGDRVLACEVKAPTLDFRDTEDPEIVVHELPPEVAERSIRAAKALHLTWTGIDYRLGDDGRYVFLEANPSPMFRGFEARCGLPLTAALAGLLCG